MDHKLNIVGLHMRIIDVSCACGWRKTIREGVSLTQLHALEVEHIREYNEQQKKTDIDKIVTFAQEVLGDTKLEDWQIDLIKVMFDSDGPRYHYILMPTTADLLYHRIRSAISKAQADPHLVEQLKAR